MREKPFLPAVRLISIYEVNGMKNDLTRIFCSVLALTILAGPGIVRAQEAHSQSAISSELAEMHRADQEDRSTGRVLGGNWRNATGSAEHAQWKF